MSNIDKWGYVYKTYNESSRGKILKEKFSFKNKKSYKYWLIGSVYFIVSLIALCFSKEHFFWSVIVIAITALCVRFFIEHQLSKDLQEYYEKNGLLNYPLFSRLEYLSYIRFRDRLKEDKKVTVSDIDSMIQWDEIKNEKIDTSIFFKSKWFFVSVTGVIGLVVQWLTELNLDFKNLVTIASLLFLVFWFSWIVYDLSNTKNKKRLDIYRFLKWFKLDSEET